MWKCWSQPDKYTVPLSVLQWKHNGLQCMVYTSHLSPHPIPPTNPLYTEPMILVELEKVSCRISYVASWNSNEILAIRLFYSIYAVNLASMAWGNKKLQYLEYLKSKSKIFNYYIVHKKLCTLSRMVREHSHKVRYRKPMVSFLWMGTRSWLLMSLGHWFMG